MPANSAKYRTARRVWFHHTAASACGLARLAKGLPPFRYPAGALRPTSPAKASRLWKPATLRGWSAALPADEGAWLPATQHEARAALIHPAEGPCRLRSRARRSAPASLTRAFRPWTLTKGLRPCDPRSGSPPRYSGRPRPGWMSRRFKWTRAYALPARSVPLPYRTTLSAALRLPGGPCRGR